MWRPLRWAPLVRSSAVTALDQEVLVRLAAHFAHRLSLSTVVMYGGIDPQIARTVLGDLRVVGAVPEHRLDESTVIYPEACWIDSGTRVMNSLSHVPTLNLRDAVFCCELAPEDFSCVVRKFALSLVLEAGGQHVPARDQPEGPEWLPESGVTRLLKGSIHHPEGRVSDVPFSVFGGSTFPRFSPPPPDFRVVAIMSAYNEADVIGDAIEHLLGQGVEVYVLDNWSTDATGEICRAYLGRGVLGVERFPPDGSSGRYEWSRILRRIDEVAQSLDANWVLRNDADEFRESPWKGVPLRNAFHYADQCGFNAVDYTVLEFPPVEGVSSPRSVSTFRHWRFGRNPGHFTQISTWKNSHQSVNLHESGGHLVSFDGLRAFPLNFLLRHYPIRSQEHGERKVFHERQARWSPEERARGWHVQYDSFRSGHAFTVPAVQLSRYDPDKVRFTYAAEISARVGIRP